MKAESYYWNFELLWEKRKKIKSKFDLFEGFNSIPFSSFPIWKETLSPVFYDELKVGYTGFSSFWTYTQEKTPVYIVDNHQKVLLGMFEQFQKEKMPLNIVHIDAHRDDAIFPFSIEQKKIEKLLEESRVCDYLDLGKKLGIISQVISLTQTFEVFDFIVPEIPFVLNLDIDIFSEEGSHISFDAKINLIASVWMKATAIYIATSPGFIDQKEAFRSIEILLGGMSRTESRK